MNNFHVEVESHRRGEWVAFVRETCLTVTATSRKKLEAAVSEHLEAVLGEKQYRVVFLN